MADRYNNGSIIMVSIVRNPENEKRKQYIHKKDETSVRRNGKLVTHVKAQGSAIPSGIGRNRRMVALSRHIADGRLRRFYIHSHIHGYPRAAKASTSNRNQTSFYCTKCIYRVSH